jgi:hypothetical protein
MFRYVVLLASAVVISSSFLSGKTIKVPSQYSKIQLAINNAKNGDTVLVDTGTYAENVKFRGKKIVLTSKYIFDKNVSTILSTVIDGQPTRSSDSVSAVLFSAGEDSTTQLIGFTLINGLGTQVQGAFRGGGILVSGESSPQIKYNIVRNNSAVIGGGIAVYGASPTIVHNAIVDNRATDGGGISIEYCLAEVNHNVLYKNVADRSGGGMLIGPSVVKISNNSITDNKAGSGGGVFCNDGYWEIHNSNFFHNVGGDFGGCLDPNLGDYRAALNFNLDSADVYLNIFVNPKYSKAIDYDFSLDCKSHLIDAGKGIPGSHPVGGAREDIGMFEYPFRVGDVNPVGDSIGDGRINLADVMTMINIIFKHWPLPCPIYAADTDCDRVITIADVLTILNYWMNGVETDCLFDRK